MRRAEAGPTSVLKETVKGQRPPPETNKRKLGRRATPQNAGSEGQSKSTSPESEHTPEEVEQAPPAGNTKVRAEWYAGSPTRLVARS